MTYKESGSESENIRKPVFATMPGSDPLWNKYVEDYLPKKIGTLKDYLVMLRMSKGRRILILNGSVGYRQLYRDIVFAIILKLARNPPLILMQDATWEPGSQALEVKFPFLKKIIPKIAHLVISALDGKHVKYAVLSTSEVKTFSKTWGVDPDRVVFQPFPNTLHDYQGVLTRDDGYLFSGGNSVRDYNILEDALEGTNISTIIATKWKSNKNMNHIKIQPTSHDDFMNLLVNSHAVVVPLRQSVRSAGQQTYLNAMGLGKPVIVTDAPGVRDYIIDGVTGVIVPPDVAKLRAAIVHVMNSGNAGFYAEMGRRARDDVFSRFTEEHFRHGLLLHAGIITLKEFEKGKKAESASAWTKMYQ